MSVRYRVVKALAAIMGVVFLAILIAVPLRYLTNKKTEYSDEKWRVGYARESILPVDFSEKEYVIAGFFTETPKIAESINGDIFVRAMCINDGSGKGTYAVAVIDSFGLPLQEVKTIRNSLADFSSIYNIYTVDVFTTHTHHSIDMQGFGSDLLTGDYGVDTSYLKFVREKTAQAVRNAFTAMQEGELFYGETSVEEFLTDGREPIVTVPALSRLRFKPANENEEELYIVASNFELNNFGADSRVVTGDIPYFMEEVLNENNIDMLFINGSFGGDCVLDLSDFNGVDAERKTALAGAEFATRLMDIESEERLAERLVHTKTTVTIPVTNAVMEYLFNANILLNKPIVVNMGTYKYSYTTEIGYLNLGGNLHIALIPGEIFPELLYGGLREEEDSLSGKSSELKPLMLSVPDDEKLLCFSMANDAIGHIIPDNDYNTEISANSALEETTSLGIETAAKIIDSLRVLIEATLQT